MPITRSLYKSQKTLIPIRSTSIFDILFKAVSNLQETSYKIAANFLLPSTCFLVLLLSVWGRLRESLLTSRTQRNRGRMILIPTSKDAFNLYFGSSFCLAPSLTCVEGSQCCILKFTMERTEPCGKEMGRLSSQQRAENHILLSEMRLSSYQAAIKHLMPMKKNIEVLRKVINFNGMTNGSKAVSVITQLF